MDPTSFLSPATSAAMTVIAQRGFATARAVQGYPVVTILERDRSTGAMIEVAPNLEVSLRRSSVQPRETGTEGAAEIAQVSEIRALEPWLPKVDQVFTLPSGEKCRISAVSPPRFGIRSAQFEITGPPD